MTAHLPPVSMPSGNQLTDVPADLLHGVFLAPPHVRWDGARYLGSQLQQARLAQVDAMAGVVATVQCGHFLGVVAMSPLYAKQAAACLAPVWIAPLRGVSQAAGGVESAAETGTGTASETSTEFGADSETTADHVYENEGAHCYSVRPAARTTARGLQVVVWCVNGHANVWLPACAEDTQNLIRHELSILLAQTSQRIQVTAKSQCSGTFDESTSPHPLDLMDAAAQAALLSQAVGRPVSVACQTSAPAALVLHVRNQAEQAHRRDSSPLAPADASSVSLAQRDAPSSISSRFIAEQSWAVRPSLARLLSRPQQASASAHATALTSVPVESAKRATVPLHASVADLNAAQVFAQESLWHEQAVAQNEAPIAWRLNQMPPGRGQDLAREVIARAGVDQVEDAGDDGAAAANGILNGTGFATAQVQCADENGDARMVWSAWVVDVAVQPKTGQVEVTRVVAGHDSQHLSEAQLAPMHATIESQSARLLADARRLLAAPAAFDDWNSPRSDEEIAASGALALRREGTDLSMPAAGGDLLTQGRLGIDGVITLPAAAAIANAIQDATQVRLRQVPFETEALRLALAGSGASSGTLRRSWRWLAAGAAGLVGLVAMAWPLKPALPLTPGPDVSLYSARAIERGRLVAAAGDCMACHTAAGGATNAGGLALDTPFGTIYSTNITPDNETGIGKWSYAAFDRAMRQGIHQDGRQLYPAFPYTAFAKMSDADMQALYGYLMTQPAVKSTPPKTELAFPFSMRPLLAGWNALFHNDKPFVPDPSRSAEWLRGAYLVEGVGHCAACHSPRNSLGAEKTGIHYLGGGEAEGWQAPALNQLASGERGWTREGLQDYLSTGFSPLHGVAAGPMAPVIHGLSELPDSDIGAIVTYLLDLPGADTTKTAAASPTRGADPLVSTNPASGSPAYPSSADADPAYPRPAHASPAASSSSAVDPASLRPTAAIPAFANSASARSTSASGASASQASASLTPGQRINGERLFQNACAACHDASSGPTLFGVKPLLDANTNLHADSPDNLIQVILHGISSPANDALGFMPGFADSFDDRQIADLVGYLRERFAPAQPAWPDPTSTISRLRNHAQSN